MHKADFPLFTEQPDLIYLDSASTTLKPRPVLEAVQKALVATGNPGRGLYPLSLKATELIEETRAATARFLSAQPEEIVFTAGTTDGLNRLARGLANLIEPGDEILVSDLEHHSNLLPWQQLAQHRNAKVVTVPCNLMTGSVETGDVINFVTPHTKVIALSLVSNVFGTRSDITELRSLLHSQGRHPLIVLDAAQAVASAPLRAEQTGADFLVFSAHKMYGPTGTGVLWGRTEALAQLSALNPGGGSVETVKAAGPIWKKDPWRLEGGTPNLEGLAGLNAALAYLDDIGMEAVQSHTANLVSLAAKELDVDWALDYRANSANLLSFTIANIHPHDVAQYLADRNICIRAGHHCAGPLHERLNLPGTCRISFGLYNSPEDIIALKHTITELRADYAHT